MFIYLVTNSINGKTYIGQTKNSIKRRWRDHLSAAKRGSLALIHKAIRKYGEEAFILSILYECKTKEELNQKEIELIKSLSPEYNIHHGGNSTFTEEHGLRVREAMKRPEVMEKVLKTRTDFETNKRLRQALKDHVHGNSDTVKKMIAGGMQHAKQVIAIHIISGQETKFESQREASRALNIPNSSIRKVLNGKLTQSHGYCFRKIS